MMLTARSRGQGGTGGESEQLWNTAYELLQTTGDSWQSVCVCVCGGGGGVCTDDWVRERSHFSTMVRWLAETPDSKEVPGLASVFLWSLLVLPVSAWLFSGCSHFLPLPPTSSHSPKTQVGDSKSTIGVNVSNNGCCCSVWWPCDRVSVPRLLPKCQLGLVPAPPATLKGQIVTDECPFLEDDVLQRLD